MMEPIPRHLEDRIQRELESGESIEWKGMPIPHYFSPASTGAFLFAIPWTAFAIFWMFGASGSGNVIFTLFGLPFVLIGIGMLSSPIWTYRKSKDTIYTITNKRVITIDGGRTTTIRSYEPTELKHVYRRERKDGSGDVLISKKEWKDSEGDKQTQDLGLMRIRDPKTIESKIKKLADQVVAHNSGGYAPSA